jgi:hypothetical protein
MKPGWVRLSLHPTMTEAELRYIIDAIEQVAENAAEWGKEYIYNNHTNEFHHIYHEEANFAESMKWFAID